MKTNEKKKPPQGVLQKFRFLRAVLSKAAVLPLFAIVLFAGGANAADDKKPQAAASIAPLHSLLAGVMGENPLLLINPGQSPHYVQLAPSQVRALHNADIFFYIGGGGEGFSGRLLHSYKGKHIVFSQTIATLPNRRPNFLKPRDKHGHDKEHDDEHRGHKHDKNEDDDDRKHRNRKHKHGSRDIHIWLDINNARDMVKQMADALGEQYPAKRETYRQNAARMDAKLAALDEEIAAILADAKGKPFAVAHDAYQYFERRYDLAQPVALRGGFAGGLSARRLRAARDALHSRGIRCVFKEPQLPARHLRALTEGGDAVIAVADPLGANIPAGEEHYFATMRQLAKSFADCLGR
ncbi:MAG: zinc ABC transporter substrate-binding protein [Gammaproteobacteria bacterium]